MVAASISAICRGLHEWWYIERCLHWDALSSSDIERIHEATLDILENVGIRFPSARALDILERNGCTVDRQTEVARLPRRVVMEAVGHVPEQYLLAGRDPDCDMVIDRAHCYLSNDGSGVFVFDHHTGEKRPSTRPTRPPRRASSTLCPA